MWEKALEPASALREAELRRSEERIKRLAARAAGCRDESLFANYDLSYVRGVGKRPKGPPTPERPLVEHSVNLICRHRT